MAERTVVGVDFSGARAEGGTWITEGRIASSGDLIIERVQPIRRVDLHTFLIGAPQGTVVALDFPFGLPIEVLESFFKDLDLSNAIMADVWPLIGAMTREEYETKCRELVSRTHKHPKRTGDHRHTVSMSPLNVRMIPMTYHGIELLNSVHQANPDLWWVPPLDPGPTALERVTLLEVMPGAFLRRLGFDTQTVKGYKNASDSLLNRERIIAELSSRARYAKVNVLNLSDFRWGIKAIDDCLDSVVAAIAAASWAGNQSVFRHPEPEEMKDARLEGWIYAPTE